MALILLVIGIPLYFFWRWVCKKIFHSDARRQIAVWIAMVISLPVVYIVLVAIFFTWLFYVPGKDFDRSKWMTDRHGRFQMADDIINSRMLVYKDSSSVQQLLGPPSTHYDLKGTEASRCWTYEMGEGGGGLGWMFHSMTVFYRNGRVINVVHNEFKD